MIDTVHACRFSLPPPTSPSRLALRRRRTHSGRAPARCGVGKQHGSMLSLCALIPLRQKPASVTPTTPLAPGFSRRKEGTLVVAATRTSAGVGRGHCACIVAAPVTLYCRQSLHNPSAPRLLEYVFPLSPLSSPSRGGGTGGSAKGPVLPRSHWAHPIVCSADWALQPGFKREACRGIGAAAQVKNFGESAAATRQRGSTLLACVCALLSWHLPDGDKHTRTNGVESAARPGNTGLSPPRMPARAAALNGMTCGAPCSHTWQSLVVAVARPHLPLPSDAIHCEQRQWEWTPPTLAGRRPAFPTLSLTPCPAVRSASGAWALGMPFGAHVQRVPCRPSASPRALRTRFFALHLEVTYARWARMFSLCTPTSKTRTSATAHRHSSARTSTLHPPRVTNADMSGAPTRAQLLKLYRSYLATAQSFVRRAWESRCSASRCLARMDVASPVHMLTCSPSRSRRITSAPTFFAGRGTCSGPTFFPPLRPRYPHPTPRQARRPSQLHPRHLRPLLHPSLQRQACRHRADPTRKRFGHSMRRRARTWTC